MNREAGTASATDEVILFPKAASSEPPLGTMPNKEGLPDGCMGGGNVTGQGSPGGHHPGYGTEMHFGSWHKDSHNTENLPRHGHCTARLSLCDSGKPEKLSEIGGRRVHELSRKTGPLSTPRAKREIDALKCLPHHISSI